MNNSIAFSNGLLLAFLLLFSAQSQAAKVMNIEDSVVPDGFSAQDVAATIIEVGGKRGWKFRKVADGHMEGLLHVRSHMAKIDVRFSAKSYSLLYKDSNNLKYKEGKIHRAYNKWVKTLDTDVQNALSLKAFK